MELLATVKVVKKGFPKNGSRQYRSHVFAKIARKRKRKSKKRALEWQS